MSRSRESRPLDPGLLRSFSPLDGLKSENLHALARKTGLRELGSGGFLFREGERDRRTYYLVSGVVELLQNGRTLEVVRGGSPQARNPLGSPGQRRCSARVASARIEYVSIDSDALDMMLTWDQTGSYEVNELRGPGDGFSRGDELRDGLNDDRGDDWMTALLQTRAFHRIPPANIQAIFMRMQRVQFKAGEVVIKQGDEGDFFYVIVKGRCVVTRETPLNKAGIRLAELGMGDTFGEEALISDARRNASVTMLAEGTLMRLAKEDFRTLLNEPMLEWVDLQQAYALVARGAKWLDVRLPSEFENYRMEGAVNLPLYFIRLKLRSLERDVHYVVCCDTGRRSSAAAYILSERGFQASVLRGGLAAAEAAGSGD